MSEFPHSEHQGTVGSYPNSDDYIKNLKKANELIRLEAKKDREFLKQLSKDMLKKINDPANTKVNIINLVMYVGRIANYLKQK